MALADDPIERLCQRQETIDLAKDIFRQAKVKTRDGSGYQIGSSTTGLPAICSLIASERLKNGDVTPETAQVASCLNKRAFVKALGIVKAALGVTAKKKAVVSYYDLLDQYRAETYGTWLPPFFAHAQNALHLIDSRYKEEDPAVRCGIFFWACNTLKIKLPSTTAFAKDHELSLKLFTSIVSTLNEKCSQLQSRILKAKTNAASPTKPTASASTPSKRTSPRKLRELPSKDTPKRAPAQSAVAGPTQKPLLELVEYSSEDEDVEMAVPETPSKKRKLEPLPRSILRSSPVKPLVFPIASSSRLMLDESPTKTPAAASTLNVPSRSVSTKKLRELPSKDSPKKRVDFVPQETEIEEVVSTAPAPPSAAEKEDVEMAAPESPRKRRKLEPSTPLPVVTPTRPVTRSSPVKPSLPSTRSSSRIDALRGQVASEAPRTPTKPKPKTPTRTYTSTVVEVVITPVRRGRPPKNPRPVTTPIPMEVDEALDAPSSSEDEEEEPRPRRFRPVYLESKQWYSRDRRLARIWKAAEKYKREMVELYGHPLDELRDDADDGMDED